MLAPSFVWQKGCPTPALTAFEQKQSFECKQVPEGAWEPERKVSIHFLTAVAKAAA